MDVDTTHALVGLAGMLLTTSVFVWISVVRRHCHNRRHLDEAEDFYNQAYTQYRMVTRILIDWTVEKEAQLERRIQEEVRG